MEVLVINYTDWIGYHVVEALLKEDYIVTGLALDEGNNDLADFFGRNSAFQLYEEQKVKSYDLVICIGNSERLDKINADKYFLINSTKELQKEKGVSISAPILFGEWMPMDEKGFYQTGDRIDFSSETFMNEGIYIADFIKNFLQWVKEPINSNEIQLKSARNLENEAEKLDKFFFVRENIPIEECLRKVRSHFEKYHFLYPQIEP